MVVSTEHVPFNDLKRGLDELRPDIERTLGRVIGSGWLVLGPECRGFETELEGYLSVPHVIGVANGTEAIELGLRALGVTVGDAVITVANAGGYTTTACRAIGALPVYVDVRRDNLLVDVSLLDECLSNAVVRPKAIVVTHLYGSLADIGQIVAWARANQLRVLEDCAQSLGGRVNGQFVGTFGDIGTTSFYPTKNLGAVGDGGAVFCGDSSLAETVSSLRQYGWSEKYTVSTPGGRNSRLDELQAAVLSLKLPYLDGWNARRTQIHKMYEEVTSSHFTFVTSVNSPYVGHLAVVQSKHRDALRTHLADAGIKTEVHYPIPDYMQPGFGIAPLPALPVTAATSAEILSIPLFPELRSDEIERICNALADFDVAH